MDLSEYQSNLDAFNNAREQLSNLVDQGRELIGGKQSIRDKIGTVLQQGGDISSGILGGLGTVAEISKGTALESTINSLKDQLTTLRQNVVDGVQKGVESGIDKATTAARNITGDNPTVNSILDSASSATKQTLTNATNQAAGGDFTGALNTINNSGSRALTTGSDIIQTGVKTARDAGTELVQAGTRAASDAVSSAGTTVNQTLAMAGNAGARAAANITGNLESHSLLAPTAKAISRARTTKTRLPKPTQEQQQTQAETTTTTRTTIEPVSEPQINLPDFPGLSDFFSVVPKTTLAETQAAAESLLPKFGSSSQVVSELGSQVGNLEATASGLGRAASQALTQAPSKVLGIVNKGQRGDSTIARALRLNQSDKPVSVKPTEPARSLPDEQMKLPTLEEYESSLGSFTDPSETILSKFIPQARSLGGIGDLESLHIATGVPKEVLAQARATEGTSLIKPTTIKASSLDNTAPQARITAPEPSAQPELLAPIQTTATPNNPSITTQSQKPSQPSSEIEPAIGPQPKPPSTTSPKSAEVAESGEAGEIAEGSEAAIEGGAALGPEGLLVGALVAGVSSLIGGLIKDFEPSKPSIPTFANTGVSFANQAQMTSGTAF